MKNNRSIISDIIRRIAGSSRGKKTLTIVLAVIIIFLCFSGDSEYLSQVLQTLQDVVSQAETSDLSDLSYSSDLSDSSSGIGDKNASVVLKNNLPEYTGKDYISVNSGIPYFSDEELVAKSYEKYGDLDSLGRCTAAVAVLGKETMPTVERGDISSVIPTGWIQARYSCIKSADLYNRSHLIAWSLSGENANLCNLITGTTHMNQEVMTQFENLVLDYIKETENHVAYRVTPMFYGNELVCRGVQMEAYSLEDDGEGICFNVYCFNVQDGIVIDYSTGESREETDDTPFGNEKSDFVINKKTSMFHLPECESVFEMSYKNKEEYVGTINELTSNGYTPCSVCIGQ